MRIRVLGAAAGGGFPQWNCNCETCRRAWAGETPAQSQASLAVTAAVCGLIIAAFSVAISRTVSPSNWVCSRLTLVTTATLGCRTFVGSRRPPRPVSTAAHSTPASSKYTAIKANSTSKRLGRPRP